MRNVSIEPGMSVPLAFYGRGTVVRLEIDRRTNERVVKVRTVAGLTTFSIAYISRRIEQEAQEVS